MAAIGHIRSAYIFFQMNNNSKKSGFTLVELAVAIAILGMIFAMVLYWFSYQRKLQEKMTSSVVGFQNITIANWKMTKELKFARNIVYPRINTDESIHSANKVVFKDFSGDLVCFYLDSNSKEIKRYYIGNKNVEGTIDSATIAHGIDEVYFTNVSPENRLIDIYIKSGNSYALETVYLMND